MVLEQALGPLWASASSSHYNTAIVRTQARAAKKSHETLKTRGVRHSTRRTVTAQWRTSQSDIQHQHWVANTCYQSEDLRLLFFLWTCVCFPSWSWVFSGDVFVYGNSSPCKKPQTRIIRPSWQHFSSRFCTKVRSRDSHVLLTVTRDTAHHVADSHGAKTCRAAWLVSRTTWRGRGTGPVLKEPVLSLGQTVQLER